jgi:hypothetical protein
MLKNGRVLLTHNQLAFLQGLLDRPRGIARSRRDLVAAATPHVRAYRTSGQISYSCLYKAVRNLPAVWVARRRVGNRIEIRLLPRGRDILEGRELVHVRGIGAYVPRAMPADIMVEDHGSVVVLRFWTEAARRWAETHIEYESWQRWGTDGIAVDPRCVQPILEGSGLTVGRRS